MSRSIAFAFVLALAAGCGSSTSKRDMAAATGDDMAVAGPVDLSASLPIDLAAPVPDQAMADMPAPGVDGPPAVLVDLKPPPDMAIVFTLSVGASTDVASYALRSAEGFKFGYSDGVLGMVRSGAQYLMFASAN